MHAQKMQLKKKSSAYSEWDQVEAFIVLTGLMIFEMLFKIMQSWALHLEPWRWRLLLQGMFPGKGEGWKLCGIVNAAQI